jgi:hypothetical protein
MQYISDGSAAENGFELIKVIDGYKLYRMN